MVVAGRGRWTCGVIGFLTCVTLMLSWAATASAEPLEHLYKFGPDGTEASEFGSVSAIAVDQQDGTVYVLDASEGELLKFSSNGEPLDFAGSSSYISENRIEGLSPYTPTEGRPLGVAQVAVDPASHIVYVTEEHAIRAFQADGEPFEFTAGPGANTSEIPGFGELFGVAVDVNGNIYASDHAGSVSIFTTTGAPITSFAASKLYNLAVASSGAVFAIRRVDFATNPLIKFTPNGPVTESTVYTESTFVAQNGFASRVGISLDPSNDDLYLLEDNAGTGPTFGGWIRRYDQSGVLIESIGEPTGDEEGVLGGFSQGVAVWAEPRELQEGEAVKLYSGDNAGEGTPLQVSLFGISNVPSSPEISLLRVTDVTSGSAVLRASVNPKSRSTEYQFEYGLEDCSIISCTNVPPEGTELGDGSEAVTVSQALVELLPNTIYHYRIVAKNVLGTTTEKGSFSTQATGGGFQLSDDRVWELVSPPNKRGAVLMGLRGGQIQAAANGDGIAYIARGSLEANPAGSRNLEPTSVVARRIGDGAWSSKDISPLNSRVVPYPAGNHAEYKLFTPDLARALLEPRDGTALSPAASERTPYIREDSEPPIFTPLVTGKEGFANVPVGTEFGGDPNIGIGDVVIAGSNRSLTKFVLLSQVPLVEDQPDAPPGLYHWSNGQVRPVSLLPVSEGGKMVVVRQIGSGSGSVQHAISEDGTRVFWGQGSYGTSPTDLSNLFLRDTESEETVRLDVARPDAPNEGTARPIFQGANADGTIVFFTDTRQLTKDASPSGRSLYRCEIPTGDSSAGCATLTNVSPTAAGSGESAEFVGLVTGLSEDGSELYFVAKGILDSAPNGHGDGAVAGEPNLYHWQEGAGVRFIATLSEKDDSVWGGVFARTVELNSSVSPSGRFFAFMSEKSLTGQENLDSESGKPTQEAFVYDAQGDELDCASCSPSGSAPNGEIMTEAISPLEDPNNLWEGRLLGAVLPQIATNDVGGISLYQARSVLNNGRVFFNTPDSLVASDANGQWDVYQFEPLGVGSCSAGSGGAAVARSGSGCVGLITSGTGEEPAGFLDASESGDDAFFLTPARLSALDKDSELDVYDARVNGEVAKLVPGSECSDQTCRSGTNPPGNPGTSSAIFIGPGNVKPAKKCSKGKHKVRRQGKTRCVRKKRGHKQHEQSNGTKGSSR